MIGNLSRSLQQVQTLLSGVAYLLGLVCFVVGLMKLKTLGAPSSQEHFATPFAFIGGGALLIYLPSTIRILANTTFGVGNVLQYATYNPYNLYNSMTLLIQTAGLIWFIRGTVLLIYSSEPGEQHGPKGLAFLFAGILAINFQNTVNYLSTLMAKLTSLTLTISNTQGY